MPSPTEQVSSETLPLKESMEPSQETVSQINVDVDDEIINFDNNKVHEEQQQQQQQANTNTTTTTTTTTTSVSASSPSHMTDAAIVNDVVNTTTPVASSITTPNNVNITTTTTQVTHDTTQDVTKAPQKRKYNRRTAKDDPPRRRTRNNSKATISSLSTQDDEQSTVVNRRTSTASTSGTVTSRRGTSTSVDLNNQIDFSSSNGRQLPSREGINPTNISDRFVEFIMYCNPMAPDTLDKVALVRSFNAVPKSDGKVFETWCLYQLVDKHYAGEIRTWTKLAQKLGVVRTPDASPQKIQQYAVRLKKWMASVHVDAYFDYLLSRPNEYYQTPQRNPIDVSDDESDVVLKLIKRAGSKRQKRKYTRKNTNASNVSSTNDDGISHPDNVSRGDITELDEEAHFESEDVDEGTDKHRGKRVRASYSDDNEGTEEEDRDPWGDEMEVDEDEDELERPSESIGTNQRKKNFVQVGFNPNWVKDSAEEEGNENIVGGRLGVRNEANPENDSSRYYRQYPSQFAYIEPKNGSNIPTPNPSPTTLPNMSLSSGNIVGNKRVLSSGASSQKLRWRITTGPTHSVKTSADESYLTTSPSSSQKDSSKKKQDAGQVRDSKHSSMARPRNNTNIPNEQQQFTDVKNYAEMLMPSSFPSDDKETITVLQNNLIRAIGMLEDSQRNINKLNEIVRQRSDDLRQRVVRALKNEVNAVIDKFQ